MRLSKFLDDCAKAIPNRHSYLRMANDLQKFFPLVRGTKSILVLLSFAFTLATSLGCSDGRLKTYPAKGKISFKTGSPVHVGTIELKSREHGVQARGSIDKDGNFTLTTYLDGDGAVAGVHDCVVVQFVMTEELGDFKPSAVGVVHPRFASYSTSGLSVEIKADEPNNLNIEVEGVKNISAKEEAKHDEKQHRK